MKFLTVALLLSMSVSAFSLETKKTEKNYRKIANYEFGTVFRCTYTDDYRAGIIVKACRGGKVASFESGDGVLACCPDSADMGGAAGPGR